MFKKILLVIAGLAVAPTLAFATPVSWDGAVGSYLRPLATFWGLPITVPYVTATSTATSTFQGAVKAPIFCISNDCITAWAQSGVSTSTPIASSQVIFGTGVSSVGSSANFTYSTTSNLLSVGSSTLSGNLTVSGITTLASSSATVMSIGTTTASQALTVAGGFRLMGSFFDTTNASGTLGQILQTTGTSTQWVATSSLGLGLTGGANGFLTRWTSASTIGTSTLLDNGTVAGVNATSSSFSFNIQGAAGVNAFNIASSTGTSLFMVSQAGNVGIGTSTPTAKLAVTGTSGSTGDVFVVASSTESQFLTVKSTGNVGIGTTSPVSALHVAGTLTATTIASTSLGETVSGLTAKTVPTGNDMFGLMDSAANNVFKKLSWSNVLTGVGVWLQTVTGYTNNYVLTASSTSTYGVTWNSSATPRTVSLITASGTTAIIVPAGGRITFTLVGGGGSGGVARGASPNACATGGGGGGVTKITFVATSTSLTINASSTIGIGGAAVGVSSPGQSNGTPGGDTLLQFLGFSSSTIVAKGGNDGGSNLDTSCEFPGVATSTIYNTGVLNANMPVTVSNASYPARVPGGVYTLPTSNMYTAGAGAFSISIGASTVRAMGLYCNGKLSSSPTGETALMGCGGGGAVSGGGTVTSGRGGDGYIEYVIE